MDGLTMPKLQRARGKIGLHLNKKKIEHLYQSGCAKLMLPKTYGTLREAVILNTAGGITGGDKLDVSIMAQSSPLIVTTQTAERLYQSSTEPAKINIELHAEQAAILHWIPQETIIFEGAEVDRTIRLDMSADSKCLLAETIVLGREAMGEMIQNCHFTDNWRLFRDGKLFHAEAFRLTGNVAEIMAEAAGGNGARILSTIFYAGKDVEQMAFAVKSVVENNVSKCAMSTWEDKLVIRLISLHSKTARADINKILCIMRQQPMPRVWQIF